MPRYFEVFFAADPMTELSEVEAHALPSYVVEADAGAIRRMEVWLHGKLERVVYPDTRPRPEIAELQRTRDAGVSTWITFVVAREADEARYSIWRYTPGGELEHRSDYVSTPTQTFEKWYYADGKFGGGFERYYDEQGEQIEVIEIRPDGRRIKVKF
ncbi:MAG TPA: hypothetical protein VIX73_16045 [Kofleriaceae bacterium]|jgi:hypothetical protein